jgi:dynein heavy chain
MQKISEKVKVQIEEFKPKVPLMVALRKKGMYTRHWEQISKKIGFNINLSETTSF